MGLCSTDADGDDEAAVAEALDADLFGTRKEVVDIDGHGDQLRVARAFHPLEGESCEISVGHTNYKLKNLQSLRADLHTNLAASTAVPFGDRRPDWRKFIFLL